MAGMKMGNLKGILMKRRKWAIGGALLVVAALVFLQGKPPVEVTVTTVETGSVSKQVEATATVESRISRSVQVRVSGEVLETLADTGDRVSPGTVLAVIDVADTDYALRGLEAQKASVKAQMAEAEHPTAEALRQAEAMMRSDAVAYGAAQRAYEQSVALNAAGAESPEALAAAEEAMVQAQQTAIVSEAAYQSLKKGLSESQKARYTAELEMIQAQIDQLKADRDRYRVLAPISGVVTAKSVEVGALTVPGAVLFEIEDPDSLYLSAEVLVQDAARLKLGAAVTARDEEAGITVPGTLQKIEPKAFSKLSDLGIEQKRVRIEIQPVSGVESLRIGMELEAEVVEAQKEQVLRLPDSAVFELEGEPHVFVVAEGVASLKAVEVGLEGKDSVEILSGVRAGDLVVDAPGNDLTDGAKVKGKKE